jgi:hypothetical protein
MRPRETITPGYLAASGIPLRGVRGFRIVRARCSAGRDDH